MNKHSRTLDKESCPTLVGKKGPKVPGGGQRKHREEMFVHTSSPTVLLPFLGCSGEGTL